MVGNVKMGAWANQRKNWTKMFCLTGTKNKLRLHQGMGGAVVHVTGLADGMIGTGMTGNVNSQAELADNKYQQQEYAKLSVAKSH